MSKTKETVDIDDFLYTISNMLESKYILADRKISDILCAIANNRDVYNTIAESMINFDFKEMWKSAVRDNFIKLPANESDRLAFIFCMLNNIDDRNLDITNLLNKYYSYDSEFAPFELFCKNVILEFKQLILKKLGLGDVPEVAFEGTPELVDEFSVLSSMIHDFYDYIMVQKKLRHVTIPKEKLAVILYSFEQAVRERQAKYFESYVIMIDSAVQKNKELKKRFEPIISLTKKLLGE